MRAVVTRAVVIAGTAATLVLSLALLWRFLDGAWRRIDLVEAPATVADAGEGFLPELPAIDVPDVDEEEQLEQAGVT